MSWRIVKSGADLDAEYVLQTVDPDESTGEVVRIQRMISVRTINGGTTLLPILERFYPGEGWRELNSNFEEPL